jgi:hypothetical protein
MTAALHNLLLVLFDSFKIMIGYTKYEDKEHFNSYNAVRDQIYIKYLSDYFFKTK